MNLAQQVLGRASLFLAKSGPQGELVTINGVQVVANVNRKGNPDNKNSRFPTETKIPKGTIIQLPYPTVATGPEVGQPITDSFGKVHTVQNTTFLGHAWECICSLNN